MSTRCFIGIIEADNAYRYIKCNTDGYPEWVGRLLLTYYPTRDKALTVIGLGDLSSLGRSLDARPESKDGIPSDDGSVAHHRDWQRDWAEVGPRKLKKGFLGFDQLVKDSDCDFGYLFVAGCWMVCNRVWHIWTPLTRVEMRPKFPNPLTYYAGEAKNDEKAV